MTQTEHRIDLGGSFRPAVAHGEHVRVGEEIARRQVPRSVARLSVARRLRIPAAVAGEHVLVRPGERVERGDVVARGPDGREVRASAAGWALWYSPEDGAVAIAAFDDAGPVAAPVKGRVHVIADDSITIAVDGAVACGIDGSGEPAHGEIAAPVESVGEDLRPRHVDSSARGKILVGGASVSAETLSRARAMGAAGVVVGAAVDKELREFLASDERRRHAGREHATSRSGAAAPFGVLLLEGYGRAGIGAALFAWLRDQAGREATLLGNEHRLYVYGATEPAPGVAPLARVGDEVVIHRLPFAGATGRLVSELASPWLTAAGVATRAGVVRLLDGSLVTVPLANVEAVQKSDGAAAAET